MNRATAFFCLLIMGSLWGLQFAMLKMAVTSGYSEPVILILTIGSLSIIYAVLAFPTRRDFPFRWDVFRFFGIASVLGYVIPILSVLYVAPSLPSGLISMFACVSPVVAILMAALLRTEKVTLNRAAAVLLGIVSIAIIVAPELELPGQGNAIWMLLALIVPVVFGIESVYLAANWPKGLSAMHALTGETFLAALLVLPASLVIGFPPVETITWGKAEMAIGVFITAGVVESMIYFHLIQRTGGVFVNFGSFISLFAGIAWGMILFDERHAPAIWIAAAILTCALYLATRDKMSSE